MENRIEADKETWKQYHMCFGCGESNPIGLKLKFKWDGQTARAEFTPNENHQGWFGYVHGGITACALDEAMGWTALYAGFNNLTAKMQTRFRKMVPIKGTYIITCTISKQTTRLIETEAKMVDRDGTVYAEATSTQYIVSPHEKGKDLKAVLWDMDGVIADTAGLHYRSWVSAFEKHGIAFSEEDFKSHFGQRNDTIIRSIMSNKVSQNEIDDITKDKEEGFRSAARHNLTPFPGVLNLLQIIQDNSFVSAIASSAPIENILLVMNELDIEKYFKAIVYGKEVTEGKPSPQVFLLAAEKVGAEPRNCIVIEDSVAGVTAAKKAGMHCIAVTNTHPTGKLIEADRVVNSLLFIGIDDLNKLFGISEK